VEPFSSEELGQTQDLLLRKICIYVWHLSTICETDEKQTGMAPQAIKKCSCVCDFLGFASDQIQFRRNVPAVPGSKFATTN
jgi:hypothetical protein